MKQLFFLAVLLLSAMGATQAQSLSQVVIGSSGAVISNASSTLNFTVGETIVGAVDNGPMLGQGFWLGAIGDEVLNTEDISEISETSVYPNPVKDVLNLNFAQNSAANFKVTLHDQLGRQVLKQSFDNPATSERLQLGGLTRGVYLLNITQGTSGNSKTFKLIKH